jgi:nucleotide-binding universal stress UspA family protein
MGALFRSVAEGVLRDTTTPLCVIRRPRLGKVNRRVLVPVVDDDLSSMTVGYAIDFGRAFSAELVFCTVCDEAGRDDEGFLERTIQQAREAGVASESALIPRAGEFLHTFFKRSTPNSAMSSSWPVTRGTVWSVWCKEALPRR